MIEVACAVIRKGNRILCLQRNIQMSLPLKWEFPGGKIEGFEDPEACVIREIFEELNLIIKVNLSLKVNIHQYSPEITVKLIPFMCEVISGEIALAEHKTYKWLELIELINLDWAGADLPIISELLKMES